MPAIRSAAQQAASRASGARSRGPVTEAGKARSARNGTRHGLRAGPFALLPGEDRDEFDALHGTVTADWNPRDAYERSDSAAVCRVMELLTAMWRQDRLRVLELATLSGAAQEIPPSEATVRTLGTFARYGARIDKDIAQALQALRALRKRPDACIGTLRGVTSKPDDAGAHTRNFTNEPDPYTAERDRREPCPEKYTNELGARTREPEPANANLEPCTVEPAPTLNRHQRRRLAALAPKRQAA